MGRRLLSSGCPARGPPIGLVAEPRGGRGLMRGIGLCLLAVFGLLVVAPAWAGSAALLKCQSEADPDRRIDLCTQVIQSATPAGDDVALAYVNRAAAYLLKADCDRAAADYDAVLRIRPRTPEVLIARCSALNKAG